MGAAGGHWEHWRGVELPVLIGRAGDRAARRFLEFFTVNIRNRNTRAAIRARRRRVSALV